MKTSSNTIALILGSAITITTLTHAENTSDQRPRMLSEIGIPTVDISGEADRRVIIAQHKAALARTPEYVIDAGR